MIKIYRFSFYGPIITGLPTYPNGEKEKTPIGTQNVKSYRTPAQDP
jgi:hypothetical protein